MVDRIDEDIEGENDIIKIVCQAGDDHDEKGISISTAMQFITLKNALDEVDEAENVETIPMPNISIETFKLCVKFARWLKIEGNQGTEIKKPIEKTDISQIVSQFEAEFVEALER